MIEINFKLNEEQLDDIVKKVTENIIKEENKDSDTILTHRESKKYCRMYLSATEFGLDSELKRLYWGFACNTLSSKHASQFDLSDDFDRKWIEKLKTQGWKEEIVY